MPEYIAPGVYIDDISAFPPSVVAMPTAIPAFIGHTERAMDGKTDLTNTPVRVSALFEYHLLFGEAPTPRFRIAEHDPLGSTSPSGSNEAQLPEALFTAGSTTYALIQTNPAYLFYAAIRHYFLNGGGPCYVTSVGSYETAIDAQNFQSAVLQLKDLDGPTLLVIPEVTRLPRDKAAQVTRAMLTHCGTDRRDRFAILDMPGGFQAMADDTHVSDFRNDVGSEALSYGAAYFPWVNAIIFAPEDFTFDNIDASSRPLLAELLEAADGGQKADALTAPMLDGEFTITARPGQSVVLAPSDFRARDDSADKDLRFSVLDSGHMGGQVIDTATRKHLAHFDQSELAAGAVSFARDPDATSPGMFDLMVTDKDGQTSTARSVYVVSDEKAATIPDVVNGLAADKLRHSAEITVLDRTLRAGSPLYRHITASLARYANILPPGAMMAGLYAQTDATRGVWKAPAGISALAVSGATTTLSNTQQDLLNADPSGKSINAIREFTGRGTLIWGARTLDGNSSEWRYVPVRRTAIFIESSLQSFLAAYASTENAAATWAAIRSAIEDFMATLWRQGGLSGSRPSDAYFVQVGLGETMTQSDIDEGIINVMVGFAPVRPAEFVILRIQQKVSEP